MRDFDLCHLDLDPVLDEGSPKSTGSVSAAMAFCEVLGIRFMARRPRVIYKQAWGTNAVNASKNMCKLTLMTQDINGRPTLISFGLTEDDSPLIVGLDLQKYSKRSFVD